MHLYNVKTENECQIHYGGEIRGMALHPEKSFDDFLVMVSVKFGRTPRMKFKDDDETWVSLLDESDYDLAIETARGLSRGKAEGKLEIWCNDA